MIDIKHRTILADAEIAIDRLFHTTETGTQPTGHQVLERDFTRDINLFGIARHGLHHRRRTTGKDAIETLLLEEGVVGHKAFLTLGTIFCGYQYAPVLLKFIEQQEVVFRAGA